MAERQQLVPAHLRGFGFKMRVQVDRRHIAYRPPFSVETFATGFSIGVDAGGLNCVRCPEQPLALGSFDRWLMELAVEALNAAPVSDLIEAEFTV